MPCFARFIAELFVVMSFHGNMCPSENAVRKLTRYKNEMITINVVLKIYLIAECVLNSLKRNWLYQRFSCENVEGVIHELNVNTLKML